MNRSGLALGVALSALVVASAAGQPQAFTPGNLVLLQVGDGVGTLSSAAAPVFLKEITTAGGDVQTLGMPTIASGANRMLTQSGSATSEGFLTRSSDKQFLVLVGYDAAPGTASVSSSAAATVNRIVGRVGVDGTIDTSTAVSDAFGTGAIRSAATADGTAFWFAGAGNNTNPGVRYVMLGAPGNTSEPISAAGTGLTSNCRVINIFNDQLHVSGSTSSGPLYGVGTLGATPPPVIGPETITQLPGFPTASGPSSYDFYLAGPTVLYVADDRTILNGGGIQKWEFTGTDWTLTYTMQNGLAAGVRSFTGVTTQGTTTLYIVTGSANGTNGNSVMTVTDTGVDSLFTTILGPTPGAWYRGIELAPEGNTAPTCYANCDLSTTAPVLNVADFSCFLTKFAAGEAYANCDLSTTEPVLNVADFSCFLTKFAAGCR